MDLLRRAEFGIIRVVKIPGNARWKISGIRETASRPSSRSREIDCDKQRLLTPIVRPGNSSGQPQGASLLYVYIKQYKTLMYYRDS